MFGWTLTGTITMAGGRLELGAFVATSISTWEPIVSTPYLLYTHNFPQILDLL